MECSECGRANPAGSGVCEECGRALGRAEVSGAAKAAFVLGLLSFVLSVFAAVPGVVAGIIGLRRIGRSRGALGGRALAIAGILCCCLSLAFAGSVWMWSFDADRIADDYEPGDLKHAGAAYDETWELVQKLALPGADKAAQDAIRGQMGEIRHAVFKQLNEVEGDVASVLSLRAEAVEGLWGQSAANRAIIKRLGEFEHINDLTGPAIPEDHEHIDELIFLGSLYSTYAMLEASRGNDLSACEALVEMNGVTRKLCASSRSGLTKMACFGNLNAAFQAAAFIINDPRTSEAALDLLRRHFTPLSADEISMRNCFIFDYVAMKRTWDEDWPRKLPRLLAKRNSIMRLLKNDCDSGIALEEGSAFEPLCVWPSFYPWRPEVSVEDLGENDRTYRWYNPGGQLFAAFVTPGTSPRKGMFRFAQSAAVMDDLLGILLAMRAGEDYSPKARDAGDDYAVDTERRIIYSRGPDGQPFTSDDIKLPMIPGTLGGNDPS